MASAVRRTTGSRPAWAHDGHAHIAVHHIVAGEPAVDFAACVEKALQAKVDDLGDGHSPPNALRD